MGHMKVRKRKHGPALYDSASGASSDTDSADTATESKFKGRVKKAKCKTTFFDLATHGSDVTQCMQPKMSFVRLLKLVADTTQTAAPTASQTHAPKTADDLEACNAQFTLQMLELKKKHKKHKKHLRMCPVCEQVAVPSEQLQAHLQLCLYDSRPIKPQALASPTHSSSSNATEQTPSPQQLASMASEVLKRTRQPSSSTSSLAEAVDIGDMLTSFAQLGLTTANLVQATRQLHITIPPLLEEEESAKYSLHTAMEATPSIPRTPQKHTSTRVASFAVRSLLTAEWPTPPPRIRPHMSLLNSSS
jgi:hypothetical protein